MKMKGLMKRIICMVFAAALTLGMCSVPTEAASAKKKALKAYSKFLSKKYISTGDWSGDIPTSRVKFYTYDIDKNGTPELLLYSDDYACHMDGWYKLYTYSKGKVRQLNVASDPYIVKRGVIASYDAWCGEAEEYYYTYSKGKLKKICYASYDCWSDDYCYYTTQVNGKNVSLETYNKKVKALKKNQIKAFKYNNGVKFKKNTAKNRKKYLLK